MFALGDILRIYAPTVGYYKYFLCIEVGSSTSAYKFLFLNSDPNFSGVYDVDCSRVPCLPRSPTGRTAVSFSMIPRFSDAQLNTFNASKMGAIDPVLAAELAAFAQTTTVLSQPDRALVVSALKAMAGIP